MADMDGVNSIMKMRVTSKSGNDYLKKMELEYFELKIPTKKLNPQINFKFLPR